MIRIQLPQQLRSLAGIAGEAGVEVPPPVTLGAVLDALEAAYPTLTGAIRDHGTTRRRAFVRLYADGEDLSDAPAHTTLPPAVVEGRQPLRVVGAIAGG